MRTRKINCHPKIRSSKSCFKSDLLKKINKKITPIIRKSCKDELCIVDKVFNKNMSRKIKKQIFAPFAPKSWVNNNNVWLDSNDIIDVMSQYEEAYKHFLFIGPSAIDFDRIDKNKQCVEKDLCQFSIKKCIKNKKTKIGIIFNTDPIIKEGRHWIAMCIDLKKKYIFYFDSNGDDMPDEIRVFRDRVQKDALDNGISLKYITNYNVRHQTKNGHCGMYCIYIIINLLGKRNPSYFLKHKISDEMMEKHRKIYYNTSI